MQKIVLGTGEFLTHSLISNDYAGVETLTIEFEPTVIFSDIQVFFDTELSEDNLTRLEVYNEVIAEDNTTWQIVGIHTGYTKPIDISCFNGNIKVKIQRELVVETIVKQQTQIIIELENAIADLTYGGVN